VEILQEVFGRKGKEIVYKNIQAGDAGQKLGKHLAFLRGMEMQLTRTESVTKELLMSGSDALGMGVVAAGCNFIASYPMSPGTTLLSFLAQHSQDFHIAVEQVEDEIAAINMALGASYAGAKTIVTTSGGGFALMEEGVSLAGMIETPLVIHIAQRPGPATGLPTRTEQADLNLALYAGHGEFPRAIFAPGDFAEMFEVAQVAFRIADASQSPVFLLTDQFSLDMAGTLEESSLKRLPWQSTITKTTEAYQRYALNATGISPRGVPNFGEGLVVVGSDEHTEDGHLTECFEVRKQMMEKRMHKELLLQKELLLPVINGSLKGKIVIVGWGSTKSVITEATSDVIDHNPKLKITTVHFKQVYPLPKNLVTIFAGAKKVIVVENNFTGQFANLLCQKGIKVATTILKYNGEPFFVEELSKKIKENV
jgi:2-oxoglutarate ferredoxin oxidoreductase subunit alpha